MQNKELFQLLQSVISHWQLSVKAYADYMENGKKFRYAEMLKVHNSAVLNLLMNHITTIPENLKKDADALIEHYSIWSRKWDNLKNSLEPGPDDEFVFENDHRFPKAAAGHLEAVFNELSGK